MFKCKCKPKKGKGKELLKEAVWEGIQCGIKHTGCKMLYMNDYINKCKELSAVTNQIKKHPFGSALSLAGLGITTAGLISFAIKK